MNGVAHYKALGDAIQAAGFDSNVTNYANTAYAHAFNLAKYNPSGPIRFHGNGVFSLRTANISDALAKTHVPARGNEQVRALLAEAERRERNAKAEIERMRQELQTLKQAKK